jgi:hypothetical protein
VPKIVEQKWKKPTFIIFQGSLKFQSCPNLFQILWIKFLFNFIKIKICQVPKFLKKKEIFFSSYIFEIIGQHKISNFSRKD